MRKSRTELEGYLRKKGEAITFKKATLDQVREYAFSKYKLSQGKTSGIIMGNIKLEEQNDFTLFCLLDSIDHAEHSEEVKSFFTPLEIERYSSQTFEEDKLEFPIRIKCLQVGNKKQWIGITTARFLISLQKYGLIRYNKEAQRVMKAVVRGDQIFHEISRNQTAIRQIGQLMREHRYYSDEISLNIPEDVNSNYYYDEDSNELVIKSIETFDIVDGFHRLSAMAAEKEKDEKFDYDMTIQIFDMSLAEVRQFIYQKDQKTNMTKSESRSMNQYRNSNDVVDRLNERGSGCELAGCIGRSGGSVDYVALSDIIEYYWFKKNKKKEYTNKDINDIRIEIKDILNNFVHEADEYYTRYLGFKELSVLFYLVKNKGMTGTEAGKKIKRCVKNGTLKTVPKKLTPKAFQVIDEIV